MRKKRRNVEQRYQDEMKKQKRKLDEFISHETEWANDLMLWYRVKNIDMPEDEYRGCAYFINKEYSRKKGSILYLYEAYKKVIEEMPVMSKETAFDQVKYLYKTYALILEKGGY